MRDTSLLTKAPYGVGVHWTSQTLPEDGQAPKSYREAVEEFDVCAFAGQLEEAGAGYLLFTISHAQQYFAFPSALLDSVLPGRTSTRDLYADLLTALEPLGIPLLFYYPSLGDETDPAWREASGYDSDPAYFARLQYALVSEIGHRYGGGLAGWWVDNCYDAAPYSGWGAGRGERYDYARYHEALSAGNGDRLIAFNLRGTDAWESRTCAGVADFAAGESNHLDRVPFGPRSGEGDSLWHGFVWMDDFWVHDKPGVPTPRFSDRHVADYLRYVHSAGGCFTYGTAPYLTGRISEPVLRQLKALKEEFQKEGAPTHSRPDTAIKTVGLCHSAQATLE